MTFALIGNQNSGKTTLFNQLTGSNQHVGNFPGVTVEKKGGHNPQAQRCIRRRPARYLLFVALYGGGGCRATLPLNEKPDGIINIVDATNIEEKPLTSRSS